MLGIYKITNKTNNHCYVGQSVNIEKRWKQHIRTFENTRSSIYNYPLYRAIRKHGIENFTFEVLEQVDNKKQLTAKEQHWFDILKPVYNQSIPSDASNTTSKPIYQIDKKTLKIVKRYDSASDAEREVKNSNIHAAAKLDYDTQKSAAGYYWCYEEDYNNWIEPKYKETKRVIAMLDKKDESTIKVFDSTVQAANYVGTHKTYINAALNGRRNTAKGYKWKYI